MFITFEGIDGSGKSTQIELLQKKLLSAGYRVEVFREPGGTDTSEEIRELVLNSDHPIHPVTELLLFSAARAQLISEKVKLLLEEDVVVILDRFYDSTTAYQGYGRASLPLDDIHTVNQIASQHTVPDLTFYLKIFLDEAQNRMARQPKDRMEQAGTDFYRKVIKGFDALAEQEERFIAVDAMQSSQEVHQFIWRSVRGRLDIQ